jgi:hypothetical protein
MNSEEQYKAWGDDTVFRPPQGSAADIQRLMTQHQWPYDVAVRYAEYIVEGYLHDRALWMLAPRLSASKRSPGAAIP